MKGRRGRTRWNLRSPRNRMGKLSFARKT